MHFFNRDWEQSIGSRVMHSLGAIGWIAKKIFLLGATGNSGADAF
jgi:hypothetical protein